MMNEKEIKSLLLKENRNWSIDSNGNYAMHFNNADFTVLAHQINEAFKPEPVEITQEQAEWLDVYKTEKLIKYLSIYLMAGILLFDLNKAINSNKFLHAVMYGYTVKKEPTYYVRHKSITSNHGEMVWLGQSKENHILSLYQYTEVPGIKFKFTEAEIDAMNGGKGLSESKWELIEAEENE